MNMDSMQDEDFLWRRAFADSSGLFGNLSYGHSLAFADPAGAAQPPHDVPIPVLSGDSPNNVEPAVPTPSSPIPDFITTSSANQVLLPCPSVPASPSPAMYVQPCQAVMPSTAMPIASMGDWANSNAGAMENVPNAPKRMPASAAATAVILAVDEQDDYQGGATQQRGADSCARKRDRAKLLRQQMNDGLDSLHEALVEISTSGANPAAAATTGLIPTRGPRRAAVVACSAVLVRDLISTCITLRAENASLTARLSAAITGQACTTAALQSPSSQVINAAGLGVAIAKGKAGVQVVSNGKNAAEVASASGASTESGGGSEGKVFGQLLATTVFSYLGPQSLGEGRRVCRSWRDKCSCDNCWENLCASRWRLSPKERRVKSWCRKTPREGSVLSQSPSWWHAYGRLHKDLRVPTGALYGQHLVIGRIVQEGVAVWIALNRRSNGMTSRSVMGPVPGALRTTEVIELRAVVQQIDEDFSTSVYPHSFRVRRIGTYSASSGNLNPSRAVAAAAMGSTFPSLCNGEERFATRVTINQGATPLRMGPGVIGGGALEDLLTSPRRHDHELGNCNYGTNAQGWKPSLGGGVVRPLGLYEYATVDFYTETARCPTERDFLRLATCVDVQVSRFRGPKGRGARNYGKNVLAVPLNESNVAMKELEDVSDRTHICRPVKRRTSMS